MRSLAALDLPKAFILGNHDAMCGGGVGRRGEGELSFGVMCQLASRGGSPRDTANAAWYELQRYELVAACRSARPKASPQALVRRFSLSGRGKEYYVKRILQKSTLGPFCSDPGSGASPNVALQLEALGSMHLGYASATMADGRLSVVGECSGR